MSKGKGFKILVTAFTTASNYGDCKAARDSKPPINVPLFTCTKGNDAVCIDANLTCDLSPNCPGTKDWSDEEPIRHCAARVHQPTFVERLLSLGVVASLSITIGTVLVAILCLIASICFCRRFCRNSKPRPPSSINAMNYPPGNAFCTNSRTGSAVGQGSFVSASQRSQLMGNSNVRANMSGQYGYMYHDQSNGPRTNSPSKMSEQYTTGSVGASSAQYSWRNGNEKQNFNNMPQPAGVRVQYMAAPRHFSSPSHQTIQENGDLRPSQISSSGFGGSQTQQMNPDAHRSTSPSSKSGMENVQQENEAFLYYGQRTTQQVSL